MPDLAFDSTQAAALVTGLNKRFARLDLHIPSVSCEYGTHTHTHTNMD
jgi:hypothetical protein